MKLSLCAILRFLKELAINDSVHTGAWFIQVSELMIENQK